MFLKQNLTHATRDLFSKQQIFKKYYGTETQRKTTALLDDRRLRIADRYNINKKIIKKKEV